MTRKPQPPRDADNPEQSRRFIDMAREVETEDSPGALDRAFEKVVQPKKRAFTPPKNATDD